ncbi:MAG: protein kinase domain-containing protein, partial [Planctomycetota bacterium]
MPKLRIVTGDNTGTEYELGDTLTVIGRRSTNQIVIDSDRVSRAHAQVGLAQNQYVVTDLGSANGTFVNGERIEGDVVLQPGDDVTIGSCILRYFADEEATNQVFVPGYTLKDLIAQGGMGKVYRAVQNSMEREVALKILHDKFAERADFVQRFVLEARSAGKLNHPNIISVHDVGKAGGTYYFSMELVGGNDLSQIMAMRNLEYGEVLPICAKVCEALEYAHNNGLVHRDIKPDNIMLSQNNDVKLADLGIAKTFDVNTGEGSDLTKGGKVLGTPHYMSPEQASGSHVDGRSDLYSLGATLYHILAGVPPFEGENNQEIMAKHLTDEPKDLGTICPALPLAVIEVVRKMMAKNRDERYATAREAAEALSKAAAAKPRPAPVGGARPGAKARAGGKRGTTGGSTSVGRPVRRKTGANKPAGPSLWAKVGVFASVLLIALIGISLVGGDGGTQVEESGPSAQQMMDRAQRREVASPPDYQGAIMIYKQVVRDYDNEPSSQRKARERIQAIEKRLADQEEDEERKADVEAYFAWEKEHMDDLDERVSRLDALAKKYPDQSDRFRRKIAGIVKEKQKTQNERHRKLYTECRREASAARIAGNYDGAQAAIQRYLEAYPDGANKEEMAELSEGVR